MPDTQYIDVLPDKCPSCDVPLWLSLITDEIWCPEDCGYSTRALREAL